MNETDGRMSEEVVPEVVYLSEYGAAVPAWVTLDMKLWMRRHWGFPLLMMALTGVFIFLMLTVGSAFLWLVLGCGFLLWRYWNGVRHCFLHGNANPGRVVSVNPPLVAVWTDLDNTGGGEDGLPLCPAVKVVTYPLRTVMGQPLEWGQAVPTAATYSGNEKQAFWSDFKPLMLEEGCDNLETLHQVLARIPEQDWRFLDRAVAELSAEGRLKPGLWKVR